jgi:lipoyl(octanoyl) transferase
VNARINTACSFIDLGLIEYGQAWAYQEELHKGTLTLKSANRETGPGQSQSTPNYLIFCEHPHVYTLGKSGDENHLLLDKDKLSSIGARFYPTNRGGDITYHGPGQLVVYPVLDLENFFTDIHRYMRTLEQSVIETLDYFGITAGRIPGLAGVWLDPGLPEARKICAMGVKTSRWVTLHGLALNVNTDLSFFDHIVPCGIADKAVTSMQKELRAEVSLEKVKAVMKDALGRNFGLQLLATAVR